MMLYKVSAAVLSLLMFANAALADTDPNAQCGLEEPGTFELPDMKPCAVYQGQGHVVITLQDGKKFSFMPADGYMFYTDDNGDPVYRDVNEWTGFDSVFHAKDHDIYMNW